MPDKAPDQVTLAEDRTVLAAERTFASWLRTGLAFLSVGIGLQRFLAGALPQWQLRAIGAVLVLCATASFAAAGWRDARTRRHMPDPDVHALPAPVTLGVALLLVALSVLCQVMVWLA